MKKIVGVIVGVIVGGGIILSGIKPVWARVSPASYMAKSMMNTREAFKEEFEKRVDILGGGLLQDEESYEEEIVFELEELKGDTASYMEPYLKGAKVEIETMASGLQGLVDITVKAGERGLGLKYYADEEQIGIQIQDMMDEYVMLDLKNYGKKFNGWPLKERLGMSDLPADLDLSTSGNELPLEEETLEAFKELYSGYLKEVEIAYTGKGELAGKKVRQFTLRFPGDLVEDAILESFELMTDDEKFQNLFYLSEGDYYGDISELKEDLKEAKNELKTGLKTIDFGDGLIFEIAIDSKERVVFIASEIELKNEYDQSFEVGVEIGLLGEKYITDLIESEVVMEADGEKVKIGMGYESNLGEKGEGLTESLEVKLVDGDGTPFKMSYEVGYQPKEEEDNYEIELQLVAEEESEITVKATGTLTQDKKAKSIALECEKVTIEVVDLSGYSGQVEIVGSLDYNYQVMEAKDLMPSKKQDIFELTEDELIDMVWQIREQFYNLGDMYY